MREAFNYPQGSFEQMSKFMFKRDYEQITRDRFTTGCNDEAIIFARLAKSQKLDFKLIEAIDKRWLNSPMDDGKLLGHAFVSVLLEDNQHVLVDPQRRTIFVDDWVLGGYEVLATGDNFKDMGLTDFDKMKELYFNRKTLFHQEHGIS